MLDRTIKKRMGRLGRIAAAAVLAVGTTLTAFVAPAAAVEPGDEVYVGSGSDSVGYNGTHLVPVYAPVPGNPTAPGEPDFWAYCIENQVTRNYDATSVVGEFSSFLGSNQFTDVRQQARVYWVLTHSYPAISLADLSAASGVPNLSVNDAIEATQYAIWNFTEYPFGTILPAWQFEGPASAAVYTYLVNSAANNAGSTPPAPAVVEVAVTPPSTVTAGTIAGPFVVSTNQSSVTVVSDPSYTFTDEFGAAIDPTTVVDGQSVYLDLRSVVAAGSATVTATAAGASGTGLIISTPVEGGSVATPGSHGQSQILVAAENATTTSSAQVSWTALAVPAIGTTLADAADDDQVLAWDGGTVTDTIAYTGLTPGQQYTVSGELMLQSDGSGTGITGSTTFTPTTADGSVEVTFTVPTGFAGDALVAFEYLYEGATATGTPVAEHADITDAAQTVTVDEAPAIGTTLVDSADDDHNLVWNGGTVVDTVAYENLTPGVEYTVSGELMLQSDGSGTGIVGSTTFTPTTADGSVEVTFTVPTGFAGDALVAFEYLYVGATAEGEPIAEHADIEDAAQTVTVDEEPVVPTIGTSLVDDADQDHNLVWNGGTVVDTIAYTGLTVGTEYTVSGELMLQSDGSATGITGSTTFTPTTADGTVDVTFTVPTGFAGDALVAYEHLFEGPTATGTPVAEHTDIEDAAQTVTVDEAPVIGTTLVDSADQDHNLVWNGGTVVDTVAYENLTPGAQYVIEGELMLQSDGSGTGITGSTTFTPASPDGSVTVTFTVPTGYSGEALVAFEYLYEFSTEGEPIAEHTDIEDAAQTVTVDEEPVVPTIGTSLVDDADQDHNLVWNGGTVVDTIAYTGLTVGTEYTVSGELMLQSDGSATGITGSTTFTPTTADGSVDVTFTVPTGFAGDALVAYEHLFEGPTATGTPVAEHTDIEDAAQTVTVDEAPAIGTTLVDSADQDHNLVWNGGTVVDTVAYENLTPGVEYTVFGELMLQADGSGTGIVGSTTFTPTTADGTVDVTFVVPTGYAGDALVAFEYLYVGATAEGEPIAEHADIDDAAQTVTVDEEPVVPSLGTSLVDGADQDHNLVWNGGTVIDTIAYTGLTVGTEYTVSGELMLQSDGSGTGIVASTTFTPTAADGTVDVTFTVPTGYAGDALVAFEYLYVGATAEGDTVAEHTDIEDAAQTVTVDEAPVIGTTLVDSADDDHNLVWNGGTVIDTIAYENLTPGVEYTVSGELMLQADGSGTGIVGSTTFTPTTADGTVDVTFVVPTGYAGDALVAFEYLYVGATAEGEPIAEHADIDDAAQTVTVDEQPVVTVPTIGTSLVDDADQDHNLVWNGGTVVDTIAYTGLTVGTEYTVSGDLMRQSDGSATGITGSTTFTPTTADGTVDVTFVVPTGYAGDALVAFEYLYVGATAEGDVVAEHTDIEDAAQTVTVDEQPVVDVPVIGTSLVDAADQDHTLTWSGGTVIDTVAYQNLTPGVEYTITGELMLKADGTGTGITGSTTFTPTTPDGTVDVGFTIPGGFDGKSLVAFEYLYEGTLTEGDTIAEHTDIDDAAQTVTVEKKPVVPVTTPGGNTGLAITGAIIPIGLVGIGLLAAIAGAVLFTARRRERELS